MKKRFDHILQIAFVWILINFIISLIGFIVLFSFDSFFRNNLLDSLLPFLQALLFQTAYFALFIFIFKLLKFKKTHFLYAFSILQCTILHSIFFTHLERWDDKIVFVANDPSLLMSYLTHNYPYFFDIMYLFGGLRVLVDGGIFVPSNTLYYYVVCIVMPALYYFLITLVSIKLSKKIIIDR
ncbi:MAG: hypothetical protein KBA86_00730 [Bacteroidales bacterium]|nr:hypothetical protein [Bacteroidales bacterium]